jgi:hypothetical protein
VAGKEQNLNFKPGLNYTEITSNKENPDPSQIGVLIDQLSNQLPI